MELEENGFLEELLVFRRGTWENFPTDQTSDFYSNGGNFDCFQENPSLVLPCSFGFSQPTEPTFSSPPSDQAYCPFPDVLPTDEIKPSYKCPDTESFPLKEDCLALFDDEELGLLCDSFCNSEKPKICDVDFTHSLEIPITFDKGPCLGRKNKVKKLEGQPSKNLMAERRRRKRLNDRLSMLRSVVPKISKMDRTSILGDTIDYMKELLDRIKNLQEEIQVGPNQLSILNIFKDLKANEILVRSAPKFEVERRDGDTRVEICCAAKPGLLLSTVNTLEALGLEIQQCVISCFNDFGLQASCSERLEQRAILSKEDIQQALFRNAGFGGRCMLKK